MVKHDKRVRMQEKEDMRLRASQNNTVKDSNSSEEEDDNNSSNEEHDSDTGRNCHVILIIVLCFSILANNMLNISISLHLF